MTSASTLCLSCRPTHWNAAGRVDQRVAISLRMLLAPPPRVGTQPNAILGTSSVLVCADRDGTQPKAIAGHRAQRRPQKNSGATVGAFQADGEHTASHLGGAGCRRSTTSRSCSAGHSARARMSATVRTISALVTWQPQARPPRAGCGRFLRGSFAPPACPRA